MCWLNKAGFNKYGLNLQLVTAQSRARQSSAEFPGTYVPVVELINVFILSRPTWAWANSLTFASTWQCHQSFDLAAIISFCRQSHKRLSLNLKHSHSRNQQSHRRRPQTTNSFNYSTCRLHIGWDPFCLLSDKSPSPSYAEKQSSIFWGEYMKYLCGCVRISLRTNWLKCGSADSDRTGSFECVW